MHGVCAHLQSRMHVREVCMTETSSCIVFDEVLNFVPEVLLKQQRRADLVRIKNYLQMRVKQREKFALNVYLIPQMMLCCIYIQWIIEVKKIL